MEQEQNNFNEGNFTKIPNELLEAIIASGLSGTQVRIFLYLLRRTFGWGRRSAIVSLNEIAFACGSIPQWISKQIQELLGRRIIIRRENEFGKKPVYKINADISKWNTDKLIADKISTENREGDEQKLSCDSMTEASCGSMIKPSCDSMIKPSCDSMKEVSCGSMKEETLPGLEQPEPQKTPKKDLKKGKKDKESRTFSEDSLYYTLAKLLLDKIMQHLPEFKQPDLQQWARTMEALIEDDKRNPETVKRVINFAQSDPFWQPNILDAESLRIKFDRLNARRISRAGKHPGVFDAYEIVIIDK